MNPLKNINVQKDLLFKFFIFFAKFEFSLKVSGFAIGDIQRVSPDWDNYAQSIKTIQNPDYKSPLRGNYLGIETEKISDSGVRFKLNNPYSGFLERLTFKVMPEHIWQDISPQNFQIVSI